MIALDTDMGSTALDSLDGLRETWDALARSCPTSHPQYLYEWVEPWWRLVGSADHSLLAIRVEEQGKTVALAPFMLGRRRARGVVMLREIRWLAAGPSDQSDILGSGPAGAVGKAVAGALVRSRRSWDEIHLEAVPEASETVGAMIDALSRELRCAVSVKRAPCYYVDTTGDWQSYLSTTSKKFVRRDLPRVRRRLEELSEVHVRRERDVDIDGFLTAVSPVHQARQDELGRASGLADDRFAAFVREAFEGLQRSGLLSVWTLHVGDDIGAYLIGFETGGVFYAWNMAHNPTYGSASPGKVLWADAIRACFDDPSIHEFNMMRGDTDYKLKWTSTSRDLLDIRIRNLSTWRSAVLNRLRRSSG